MLNNKTETISPLPLRWLFLDLNSYFASVEQQENPRLRNKPVAVVPVLVDSTCCIAVSYEAKAFGVKTGTSVAEAKLLCPRITFVTGRHDVYVKYHHAIVAAVESQMHVDDVLSIDEMVGLLHGSECEPANAIALAHRIKKAVTTRVGECLRSSIGIAPNRFLAKVAGEMQKPDGLTVLESSRLPEALYPLKLRDLPGIGRNMEKRLEMRGIGTVQHLCSLDVPTMRELWGGIGGERFALWLRGQEVALPASKHHSIGHSHVLEPEFRNREGVMRVAKLLTDKAALRLRKMGYWAAGFSLGVRLAHDRYWEHHIKLDESQDTPTFLTALNEAWKEFPKEKPNWVGVSLAPLVAPERHVASLFSDKRKERLSHVMDAINEKYGKNAAYFANPSATEETAPTRIAFSRVPDLSEF